MNSESFAEYLAQPAKLYQLPYQEIKNLVEEYPYVGNLRLLMFIKSKIEQDPTFEAQLHKLAAHTFDRGHLYDLNRQQLKEMLDLATGSEERLELQDLTTFEEKELLTVDQDTKDADITLAEAAIPATVIAGIVTNKASFEEDEELIFEEEETIIFEEKAESTKTDVEIIHSSETTTKYQIDSELIDTISAFPLLYTDGNPQVKTTFISWQEFHLFNKQTRLQTLRKKAEQSILGFDHPSARQVAAQSIQQKQSVATETLAKLLEKQGNFEKAIKMYEQLSLLNPNKSRYFAAIIEKLKQNI